MRLQLMLLKSWHCNHYYILLPLVDCIRILPVGAMFLFRNMFRFYDETYNSMYFVCLKRINVFCVSEEDHVSGSNSAKQLSGTQGFDASLVF